MEKKPVTHFLVGGIMGAITILSSVILIITDQIQNQSLGWISTVLMFIALVYFVRDYGNAKQNQLSFGDLFAFGFKSSAFATILILVFQVIFNLAFPEMLDKMLEITRQKMLEQNPQTPDDQIEMALGFTKKFFWPLIIGGTIFGTLFFGTIGSLIGAAITKNNPPTPFQHA
jgi:integral membrane sensor domain MASE1